MDVHLGNRFVHGAGDIDVVVAVEVGVNTALKADLRRTEIGCFLRALYEILEREEIWSAAKVERQRTLAESAELALERTDVGVVDVAIVDERNLVAIDLPTKIVGNLGDGDHFRSPCFEQSHDLVESDPLSETDTFENFGDASAGTCDTRNQDRRSNARARVPRGRPRSELQDLDPVINLFR